MENVKTCTKCGKELPLDQFRQIRRRNGSIGYRSECKDCAKVIAAKRYKDNPGKVREVGARWRRNNLEKDSVKSRRWRKNNPEKVKAMNIKRRRAKLEIDRVRRAQYRKDRGIADPSYKLMQKLRTSMYMAFKNVAKTGHTIDLLGCPIDEFRSYLEMQFLPGMTWDNYGRYGWHIDHIIPLSYFDFTDPEQQRRAWHYTNLRPLWATDNWRKQNKIEERQLVLL